MRRAYSAVAAGVLAGALVAAATALGSGSAATPLKGTVGPGFTISLTKAGKKVTSLKPGSYTFVISDRSSIHDFTLEQQSGGKFEKHLTGVPFTGTATVKLTLKAGKWKFYCSAHPTAMFGFVKVSTTAVAATSTTPATTTTSSSGYGNYG